MDTGHPSTFINPFTVSSEHRDEFRKRFAAVTARLVVAPGFIDGALHVAVQPDEAEFAFVNVNRWASQAAFRAAIADVDPEAMFGALSGDIRGHGASYLVDQFFPVPEPADLVRRYFAAAHRSEASLLVLVADDAMIAIPASLPYGGEHRGHAGFRHALAGFAAAWRDVATHDLRLIGDGATIVALSRMTARAAATGAEFETRVAETFVVRAGLIAEVRPYYHDTAAMLGALWPSGDRI